MKILKDYWKYIVVGLVIAAIGFFAGRLTINEKIVVEYIPTDPIIDSIPYPVPEPYEVLVPVNPTLPLKKDTIFIHGKDSVITQIELLQVDTAAIISEFIKEKSYEITLFDREDAGKMIVKPVVQYNELQKIPFEFYPVQKQTTIYKEKIFTPFATASYNSFRYAGVGGGIYLKNVGLGAKYLNDFNGNTGYEGAVYIKF